MITIEVIVPGDERNYEVKIPKECYLSDLTDMVIRAVSALCHEDFSPEGAFLCDASTGSVLDVNKTAEQLGLINGSQILLL